MISPKKEENQEIKKTLSSTRGDPELVLKDKNKTESNQNKPQIASKSVKKSNQIGSEYWIG